MAQWKYTIEHGKALREAIEDGNTTETIESLKDCCTELLGSLKDRDIDYFAEDLQDMIDTLDDVDIYDTDEIDDCLRDFYDICDVIRVWISI